MKRRVVSVLLAVVCGAAALVGVDGPVPAVNAQFVLVHNVATDPAGNVYIADSASGVVRKVDASTGVITTVAGRSHWHPGCCRLFGGDGGPPGRRICSCPRAWPLTPPATFTSPTAATTGCAR